MQSRGDPWGAVKGSASLSSRRGIGWFKRVEQESGVEFLLHRGRLNIGTAASVDALCDSYAAHGVAHTRLAPDEVAERWGRQIRLAAEERARWARRRAAICLLLPHSRSVAHREFL